MIVAVAVRTTVLVGLFTVQVAIEVTATVAVLIDAVIPNFLSLRQRWCCLYHHSLFRRTGQNPLHPCPDQSLHLQNSPSLHHRSRLQWHLELDRRIGVITVKPTVVTGFFTVAILVKIVVSSAV